MIFKRKTINPYEWHKMFTFVPVLVNESLVDEKIKQSKVYGYTSKEEKVMYEEYAFFCNVERRLESNMTGTRKWIYRKIESK